MSVNRRSFLKTMAIGGALLSTSEMLESCSVINPLLTSAHRLKNFGLQLYTVRDVIGTNTRDVLKQIAGMGYTQIESYEGDKGFFWGMSNLEFKKLMDDLGMDLISSHCNIRVNFETKVEQAAQIGMKYLIDPWEGPQKSIDDFKRIADLFNEKGKICKQHGLRFGYHNHGYSFKEVDGQLPQDVMMQNTDPDLVDFEMDVYWVVTAGQDPARWLKKYPGRWKLSHLKDRKKNVPLTREDETCVLGTGEIDWKKIVKDCLKEGMNYFIVEQEQYDNMSSLDAARLNAQFLKVLKV